MKNFEICIRAIIQSKNRFLICWHKEKNYYFFPGGHIKFGESAKKALLRELKEELGISVKRISFIGAVENIFTEENQKHHELNLIFEVEPNKIKVRSGEDHIDFFLITKNDFRQKKILPLALKKSILKWLKDKKLIWASQI